MADRCYSRCREGEVKTLIMPRTKGASKLNKIALSFEKRGRKTQTLRLLYRE
jgi:hypothetical protein